MSRPNPIAIIIGVQVRWILSIAILYMIFKEQAGFWTRLWIVFISLFTESYALTNVTIPQWKTSRK